LREQEPEIDSDDQEEVTSEVDTADFTDALKTLEDQPDRSEAQLASQAKNFAYLKSKIAKLEATTKPWSPWSSWNSFG
jgi:hypothetical protein